MWELTAQSLLLKLLDPRLFFIFFFVCQPSKALDGDKVLYAPEQMLSHEPKSEKADSKAGRLVEFNSSCQSLKATEASENNVYSDKMEV